METKSKEQSVFFSANNVLNIQKLTNVNGKNIYQIDMGDCLRYISPENSPVYIGIIYNDILHIFNLIEDGEFPDDFKVKLPLAPAGCLALELARIFP